MGIANTKRKYHFRGRIEVSSYEIILSKNIQKNTKGGNMGYYVTMRGVSFTSLIAPEQVKTMLAENEFIGFSDKDEIEWNKQEKSLMIVLVATGENLIRENKDIPEWLYEVRPYGDDYYFKYDERLDVELTEVIKKLLKPGTSCTIVYDGDSFNDIFGHFITEEGIFEVGCKLIVHKNNQWHDVGELTTVSPVKVNGVECRFTYLPGELPWFKPTEKLPYRFDIRHGEDGEPCTIEKQVFANYYGTILSPVDFLADSKDGYVDIRVCPDCNKPHPDFISL